MKRLLFALMLILLLLSGQLMLSGQSSEFSQVPTLVPPTPIPREDTGAGELLPSRSAVGRIQDNGVVRVGMLFNAPPFGVLNVRGDLIGFDPDLARSIAELWGVEIEFVQVTRDPAAAANLLVRGDVDMLVARQIPHRDLLSLMEFSDTYYVGQKTLMVRSEDGQPTSLAEIEGQRVGVVIATPSQQAVLDWQARNGIAFELQTYLTLDQAHQSLLNGEIAGVIDSDYRLEQVSSLQPELVRILDEPVELEPVAIAVQRQDASMRDLVNKTLQYLTFNGRIAEIHQVYFPSQPYEPIFVWDNLGEEPPTLAEFSDEIVLPEQYVVGRLAANPVVRVAGLLGVTADSDAPESERRLDTFHRALLQDMATRWGVTVEFVPNSRDNAVDLVAAGEADIALAVSPDWAQASRVDYTTPYLRHGYRLMLRAVDRADIRGFADLSGELLLIPTTEPETAAYAVSIAEPRNWTIDVNQQREEDLAFVLLGGNEDIEAEAVFASSFKLVPQVQNDPSQLVLTDQENGQPRWYSPPRLESEDFGYEVMTFATPANDIDFRLLIELTLQEMARDGALDTLLLGVMLAEEFPEVDIWPGPSRYLNFNLTR